MNALLKLNRACSRHSWAQICIELVSGCRGISQLDNDLQVVQSGNMSDHRHRCLRLKLLRIDARQSSLVIHGTRRRGFLRTMLRM